MPNATVLVVDDEPLIRWSLVNRLKEEGYRTLEAGTAGDAVAQHRDGVDLVLLDFALPDANGLSVLKQIKDTDPDTLVIMLTANTDVGNGGRGDEERRVPLRQQAVRSRRDCAAGREGARDDAAAPRGPRRCAPARRSPTARTASSARARRCRRVRALLEQIASSPASTVLLTGESGTGKDLAAKVMHYSSSRAAKPFMNITCSALPETLLESELFGHERGAFTGADRQKRGLIESADGGTRVPRRDRRDGAAAAGQAAALPRGEVVQARRRLAGHPGRRPRHRRDQSHRCRTKSRRATSARTCSIA